MRWPAVPGRHDGGSRSCRGVAQEKTRVWRTRQRRDPVTGKRYPWLARSRRWSTTGIYGFDADFGPSISSSAATSPTPADLPQRHEYAKRQAPGPDQLHRPGQRVAAADDQAAVQRICDG